MSILTQEQINVDLFNEVKSLRKQLEDHEDQLHYRELLERSLNTQRNHTPSRMHTTLLGRN